MAIIDRLYGISHQIRRPPHRNRSAANNGHRHGGRFFALSFEKQDTKLPMKNKEISS